MLELTKKGNEVFYKDKKLTIIAQTTKGEGKEVVKVEGIEEANGQKFISLSKLVEGTNTLECKPREVVNSKKYVLTETEKLEVEELQTKIDKIIEVAKSRYVPTVSKPIAKMTETELAEYVAKLQIQLNAMKVPEKPKTTKSK